jgi:hypothetical protein
VGTGLSKPIVDANGNPLYGANLPGQTWKLFMDTYLAGHKQLPMATKQMIAANGGVPKPKPTFVPVPTTVVPTHTPKPTFSVTTGFPSPSAPPSTSLPPTTSAPPSTPAPIDSSTCGPLLQSTCPPGP